MKVKLKTWEEFEKEFKPEISNFFRERIDIRYENFIWIVCEEDKKYFGKEIEVEKINHDFDYITDYTHKFYNGINYTLLHELWFDTQKKKENKMTKKQQYIYEILNDDINTKTSDVIISIRNNHNVNVSTRHIQRIRKRIKRNKKINERKEKMTLDNDVFDINNIPTDDETNIINHFIEKGFSVDSQNHIYMVAEHFKISTNEVSEIIKKFRWLIDKNENDDKVEVTDMSLADINPNWVTKKENNKVEDNFWEVKIDCVTQCSKVKNNVKVSMNIKAKEKAILFMNWAGAREWLAYLVGEKIDQYNYIVNDLYIPDQRTCSTLVDNVNANEYNDHSIIGVIHSHHEMGAGDENNPSFSSHDDNFINGNHNISLLAGRDRVTKGFKIVGIARIETPCGGLMQVKANVLYMKNMSLDDQNNLKRDFLSKTQTQQTQTQTQNITVSTPTNITRKNGVVTYHFGNGGWPGNQF